MENISDLGEEAFTGACLALSREKSRDSYRLADIELSATRKCSFIQLTTWPQVEDKFPRPDESRGL